MNKKLFIAVVVSLFGKISAQSVVKTMLRLPDTGQNKSYTNTIGEDNDFNINVPYFKVLGNGVVTDTVTSLMWQQADGGEMTFDNAIVYCDTLTLGGFSDWRMPTAHESFSILNHQFTNPAMDPSVFTKSGAEYWWTSTLQANDNSKAWVTNAGGGIGNHPKAETLSAGGTKKFHVRAVRDVKTPIVIGTPLGLNSMTVSDQLTGLEWQRTLSLDTLSWEQALLFADTSTIGGFSDWRLPNIKELQSINDESKMNPSINSSYFVTGGAKVYWSSTTLPNQTAKAWYLNSQYGITSYDSKTRGHYVLCVRGGEANTAAQLEFTRTEVLVFPNPFRDVIHLQGIDVSAPCRLIDILGKVYYNGNSICSQDFSELPKGSYLLIVGNQSQRYLRLIKE